MTRTTFLSLLSSLSVAALTACTAGTTSSDALASDQQALTEAAASADDAKATAESCFTTFETCESADGADVKACKSALHECLPAEAHPGPHCGPPRGKGKGHPRGPNGGRGPEGGPDGGPPPPRQAAEGVEPADGANALLQPCPDGGADRPRAHEGPPPAGEPGEGREGGQARAPREAGTEEPEFCAKVPLPPPSDLGACGEKLAAELDQATTDERSCFEAHQRCVKAAFDGASSSSAASSTAGSAVVVN